MKQYDVEISAIACFGYTCCKLFMTEVNLRDVSSDFEGIAGDFDNGWAVAESIWDC